MRTRGGVHKAVRPTAVLPFALPTGKEPQGEVPWEGSHLFKTEKRPNVPVKRCRMTLKMRAPKFTKQFKQ